MDKQKAKDLHTEIDKAIYLIKDGDHAEAVILLKKIRRELKAISFCGMMHSPAETTD